MVAVDLLVTEHHGLEERVLPNMAVRASDTLVYELGFESSTWTSFPEDG
jgi:hypothetical protein